MLGRALNTLSVPVAAILLAATAFVLDGNALAKKSPGARQTVIHGFLKQVNAHQGTAAARHFDSSALLLVTKHTYRGRAEVTAWLRDQVRHGVHLKSLSGIHVSGANMADLAVLRTTRGGDCSHGCSERWTWQINGLRVQVLRLRPLTLPAPLPEPVKTVPPPPSAPPPVVTPTIPT